MLVRLGTYKGILRNDKCCCLFSWFFFTLVFFEASHYSTQSGKLSNLCCLTGGYRTLIVQIAFCGLGSSLGIP